MSETGSCVAEKIAFIRTAWQASSRYHGKIIHIINQALLLIEIVDRLRKMM